MEIKYAFQAIRAAALCCMIASASAVAQEAQTESATEIKNDGTLSAKIHSLRDEPSENPRVDAIRVIDQMIVICNHMGDKENAASTQTLRDQFSNNSDERTAILICENSVSMLSELRRCNELIIADDFMRSVLSLAKCLENEAPRIFMATHFEAAQLDVEFERYDSALKHIDVAQQVGADAHISQKGAIALRATKALVFRKLQRFDEAEQIYSELLQQTDSKSEAFSDNIINRLQFARAVVYAEKCDFKRYAETCPSNDRKILDDEGNRDYATEVLKATAIVNYNLTANGDIKVAADKAEQLVERTKQYYGVPSRRHFEAIELLAKVRVAQDRNADAVSLLTQAADHREKLLGKEHASIARIHNEIDSIRK